MKHLNAEEFVTLATKILGLQDRFEDDMLIISRNHGGLDLEITRKPMPDVASHLAVDNPTTMVAKGKIIRHHGEHCYLVEHMISLAEKSA